MIRERGAVLIESAFALTFQLAIFYGTVELGMVGLAQISADGGAFVSAHQAGIVASSEGTGYINPIALAKSAVPQTNASTVTVSTPVPGQPPASAEGPSAEDYYLNEPSGRHGGVSMVLPTQTLGSVTNTGFASLVLGALQSSVSVTGIAIDPAFQLINGHFNIGGNAFGTAASFQTATNPLTNGANTPPFFIGFNELQYCPFTTNSWSTCPSGYPQFANLALAEYLDDDNWGLPKNGVTPDDTTVFWHARLHQSVYAKLASELAIATSAAQASGKIASIQAALNPQSPGVSNAVGCAISFADTSIGSSSETSFAQQGSTLTPSGDPNLCAGF